MSKESPHQPLGGLPVAAAPKWTNPNVGMLALIAATYQEYGEGSIAVLRAGMRRLGRRTGQYMLETHLVAAGCTPTEWGRFSHQLMELTGFYTYEEVEASENIYCFRVPSDAMPYHEPIAYLGAPPDACDILCDWDRGCLETINPRIRMTQPLCSVRGDEYCFWQYDLLQSEAATDT
jgi:hypothetical protein